MNLTGDLSFYQITGKVHFKIKVQDFLLRRLIKLSVQKLYFFLIVMLGHAGAKLS